MAELETLVGTVDEVVYHNDENDYTVLSIIDKNGYLVTAVGKIAYAAEGEDVTLYGKWVKHADYGEQFAFENYERELPTGRRAMLRYLSSRVIKGVGPVTAQRIVDTYGEESFSVIEYHPEWLTSITGISAAKAAQIHESFMEQTGIRALMMFCRDFFSTTVISRIYKQWGTGAVERIKENPYRLTSEIYGIPFAVSDRFAMALGFAEDAACRIEGGIRYVFEYNAATNGHTCLPRKKLIAACAEHLAVGETAITAALAHLEKNGTVVSYTFDGAEYLALDRYASAEEEIARRLVLLDKTCPAISVGDVARLIDRTEQEQGLTYAPEQRDAVYTALSGGVTVLMGGPGTGKTTVVRGLLRIFDDFGLSTLVLAPTGRAANRICEAARCEAKTIHRALEMERSDEREPIFRRDEGNPLDARVVIVDECSMIDTLLMAALLRALARGTRLILIGDADQLPSVGAGRVLCDLIESAALGTVALKEIFRQSEASLIVTNAHRINRGEAPHLDVKDKDFFFLGCPEDRIPDTVADLLCRRLPRAYGEKEAAGIQIITPSRKGRAGTEQLNVLLQSVCNPPAKGKKEMKIHGSIFREGDRVMQTRNDYDIVWHKKRTEGNGVFNGEIGVLEAITEEGATVAFDDRTAEYTREQLEDLDHSYAITVHKSQGSEYPTVILPMYSCPPMLETRNLLYTAVTRACTRVILVGRREVVGRMVANNRHVMRYTTLPSRMRDAKK